MLFRINVSCPNEAEVNSRSSSKSCAKRKNFQGFQTIICAVNIILNPALRMMHEGFRDTLLVIVTRLNIDMDRELLRTLILDDVYYTVTLVILCMNCFGIGLVIGYVYSNI